MPAPVVPLEVLGPRERIVRIAAARASWLLFIVALSVGIFDGFDSWESAAIGAGTLALLSRRQWKWSEFWPEYTTLAVSLVLLFGTMIWDLTQPNPVHPLLLNIIQVCTIGASVLMVRVGWKDIPLV